MTQTGALSLDLHAQQMIIQSDLLGDLTVQDDDLFRFSQGLYGFPDCHDFTLIRAERPGLFWLQSVEHSALSFLTIDPFTFFPDYVVDVPTGGQGELDEPAETDLLILAIVTLPRSREEKPTANLQGPLLFNLMDRTAAQIVLAEERFSTREPFDIEQPIPAQP